MPAKTRVAKTRRRSFSPEAIALFLELERMSRRNKTFRDKTHELARMLGLVYEWWNGNHVNDRADGPCHPPGYAAFDNFFRVRAVREELLAAAGGSSARRLPPPYTQTGRSSGIPACTERQRVTDRNDTRVRPRGP